MKRGEVWTIAGEGYAGKPRPAVIVQDDRFDATDRSQSVPSRPISPTRRRSACQSHQRGPMGCAAPPVSWWTRSPPFPRARWESRWGDSIKKTLRGWTALSSSSSDSLDACVRLTRTRRRWRRRRWIARRNSLRCAPLPARPRSLCGCVPAAARWRCPPASPPAPCS